MRPLLMFGVGALLLALAALPALAASKRIVSLGGGITATLDALGLGGAIVAVDASSGPPAQNPAVARVGYYRQLSAEGVLALRPDHVIGPVSAGPAAAVEQLKASGARVDLLPPVKTVDGARARIAAIGGLVGRPAEAAALVRTFDEELAKAKAIAEASGKKPRVLFLFVHGGASLQVGGTDTAAHAMITAAGATNAGEHAGYRPLTAEGVVVARPDVLLATPRSLASAGGAEALWKNPGIAATPAGQNKKLVVVDDVRLLGFGPDTGAVARELAEVFRK